MIESWALSVQSFFLRGANLAALRTWRNINAVAQVIAQAGVP
jgi:hypothetical protein